MARTDLKEAVYQRIARDGGVVEAVRIFTWLGVHGQTFAEKLLDELRSEGRVLYVGRSYDCVAVKE